MASSLVKEFVDSCSAFSEGTSSKVQIATLRKVTEEEMPERYRMPFPEPTNTATPQQKDEERQRHLRGLWHELAQHLRDLRYLTEPEFIHYHQHKKDILKHPTLLEPVMIAVRLYLGEEKEWPELAELLPRGRTIDLLWLSQHLSAVVTRIGFHTIWDGSALAPEKYVVGEKTVFSRALAFRLRVLSSPDFTFSSASNTDYYTGEDNEVLNLLFSDGFSRPGVATASNVPRGYWTALGNLDKLLTSFTANKNKKDLTILYQIKDSSASNFRPLKELKKKDLKFRSANWDTFHENTSRSIFRRARRKKDKEDGGLGIRLLQIKLWQSGYYDGTIDGDWQELSHRALSAFIMDKAEEKQREFPRKKAGQRHHQKVRKIRSLLTIVSTEHRVYAADIKAVLDLLKAEGENPKNQLDLNSEHGDLHRIPELAGITTAEFDEKVLKEEGLGHLYPDNVEKPKRRVSFFRRLGGALIGGVKKVVTWLKEGIKRLLGPVFSFVKLLLRPIRNAIHRFFQGFKYLTSFVFGRPIVTETAPATETEPARVFATKFQLDFDALNFVPAGFEADEPGQHATHLQRMQEDMAYFIDGVIWVIKAIGKLSNPGGWVWLGWQIMRGIVGGVPGLAPLLKKPELA